MILSVHQPQYLPWLGYFHKIAHSDTFVFLDNVQYKKREYQNRNRIRTDTGELLLTVPVLTRHYQNQLIKEVLIDNSTDWYRTHRESIKRSYIHAPYFKNIFTLIEPWLTETKWDKLVDLNVNFILLVLQYFNLNTRIYYESELNIDGTSTQRIVNICKQLSAATYLSGQGGKDYLNEQLFDAAGLNLKYQHFVHPEYQQQYTPFIPYMSVLDLMFNHGPQARNILLSDLS